MTPQKYLKDRLETCSHYELSEVEKEYIEKNGLRDFLYKQITRKKFRKWKVQEPAIKKINEALDYCLSEKKPIVFTWRFGAYKLWRYPTAPEADWAEFFNFAHLSSYLAPIIAAYPGKVQVVFRSDDIFVERLNNVPKDDTRRYRESFNILIEKFKEFFPANYNMCLQRHIDLFDSKGIFEKEFEKSLLEAEKTWKEKRTREVVSSKLKTSELNIRWDGVEDLRKLSDAEKNKKIEQGVIYHDALVAMPTIRSYGDEPDKIHLLSSSLPIVVAIGSSKRSVIKIQVGTGILEKSKGAFQEHIISFSQYENLSDVPYKEEKVDLIPLKNFKTVRVYDSIPNFSLK